MPGENPKKPRGGSRPGAGRPSNRKKLLLSAPELLALLDASILEAAGEAVSALVRLLSDPGASAAQVSAARYLIDRALGRPREQLSEGERSGEAELQRLRIEAARAALARERLALAREERASAKGRPVREDLKGLSLEELRERIKQTGELLQLAKAEKSAPRV